MISSKDEEIASLRKENSELKKENANLRGKIRNNLWKFQQCEDEASSESDSEDPFHMNMIIENEVYPSVPTPGIGSCHNGPGTNKSIPHPMLGPAQHLAAL